MSFSITSHLPSSNGSGDPAIKNREATTTSTSVTLLRAVFSPSLSKDHQLLAAAAERAKIRFSLLSSTQDGLSAVEKKIIQNEKGIASNAAASTNDSRSSAVSVIKALRSQSTDQQLLSTVTGLESRLQQISDQAAQSATHAAAATQRKDVQIHAKAAARDAAEAQLILAQLRQLQAHSSNKISKQVDTDLKTAEIAYEKASQELTSLRETKSLSFQHLTDINLGLAKGALTPSPSSQAERDDDNLVEDDGGVDPSEQAWSNVSDEEATRSVQDEQRPVELETMRQEDRQV